MRSTSLTLLLAGALGFATYHYNSPRDDAASQLAKVTRILTLPADQGAAEAERPRVFSPQRPLILPAEQPVTATAPTSRTAALASPSAGPVQTLPAVEAVQPRRSATPAEAPANRLTSTRPTDEATKDALVRDLQKELKRVGCYEGDVDGDWGTGSKRAMRAFTERVNASLPTEEPDFILLTLVRGHQAAACGKGCPSSQALDGEGRCVPKAILAQSGRKPVAGEKRSEPDTRTAEKRDADRARPAESANAGLAPRQSETRVAAAPATASDMKRPSAGDSAASAQSGSQWRAEVLPPVAAVAPLPGRMAIGGPAAGGAGRPDTTGGTGGGLRPGALAALEREGEGSLPAAAPLPAPPPVSRSESEQRSERRASPQRPQRERAERERAYRPPPRAYYAPPPPPRPSPRYSSFSRPDAVRNFFFDPKRSF